MKKWTNPEVAELNINETANGIIKIGWEGPFNIVFGDNNQDKDGDREDEARPSTPTTDPTNPVNPVNQLS